MEGLAEGLTLAAMRNPPAPAARIVSPDAATADDEGGPVGPGPLEEELVEEDLLVEEISIDGMCGVY